MALGHFLSALAGTLEIDCFRVCPSEWEVFKLLTLETIRVEIQHVTTKGSEHNAEGSNERHSEKSTEKARTINVLTNDELTAFLATLGRRIKRLRKEKGLLMRDIMIATGYYDAQWRKYEAGGSLNIASLLKIALALDVTLVDLLDGLGQWPKLSVDEIERQHGIELARDAEDGDPEPESEPETLTRPRRRARTTTNSVSLQAPSPTVTKAAAKKKAKPTLTAPGTRKVVK